MGQIRSKDWSIPKHRPDGNEHSVTAPLAVLAVEVSVNIRPEFQALCTAWARHLAFLDTEQSWEMSTAITNITACTWKITHETPLWLCTECCKMVLLSGNNRCTGNTLKFWSTPPPQICVWADRQGMRHCNCSSPLVNLVFLQKQEKKKRRSICRLGTYKLLQEGSFSFAKGVQNLISLSGWFHNNEYVEDQDRSMYTFSSIPAFAKKNISTFYFK